MRRWLVLLVVALLVMPSAAMAQEATPTAAQDLSAFLPSVEDLGGGWIVNYHTTGLHPALNIERSTSTYFGPNGARLIVVVFELPDQLTARAEAWESVTEFWQRWADSYGFPDSVDSTDSDAPHVKPASTSTYPLPAGVNDGLRSIGNNEFWRTAAGVGLYALEDGPAVLILLEGNYNSEDSIAAVDAIAELIATK